MVIFVAKLAYRTDEDQLRKLFEQFGEVKSSKIAFDRVANRSKGFGFVEMPNHKEATLAINSLNNKELDGRTIVVKESLPATGGTNNFGRKSY